MKKDILNDVKKHVQFLPKQINRPISHPNPSLSNSLPNRLHAQSQVIQRLHLEAKTSPIKYAEHTTRSVQSTKPICPAHFCPSSDASYVCPRPNMQNSLPFQVHITEVQDGCFRRREEHHMMMHRFLFFGSLLFFLFSRRNRSFLRRGIRSSSPKKSPAGGSLPSSSRSNSGYRPSASSAGSAAVFLRPRPRLLATLLAALLAPPLMMLAPVPWSSRRR
jgi:hypothetical protein